MAVRAMVSQRIKPNKIRVNWGHRINPGKIRTGGQIVNTR